MIRSPHPFNFSGLRSLSISTNTELIHSPSFVPALQAIETLDLAIEESTSPGSPPRVSPHVGTSNEIVASGVDHPRHCRDLQLHPQDYSCRRAAVWDSQLSVPMHDAHVMELEMSAIAYANAISHLPRLKAANLVRRGDFNADWFRNHAGIL
ncbi:hypothetical protein C8R44DRAFT_865129 [Mycena epipterygia]|nr:hypothetical protein C8R44DRAFT_865129 [Mycena epipterygia]